MDIDSPAIAEQLMLHKNTVQYRIRKAEESLGRPVAGHRRDVERALASPPCNPRQGGAGQHRPATDR